MEEVVEAAGEIPKEEFDELIRSGLFHQSGAGSVDLTKHVIDSYRKWRMKNR